MAIAKKPKQLEKNIEKAILTYLEIIGVFAWKNKTMGTFDPTRKIFRKSFGNGQTKGMSDILGILKDGRFLAIEVKTPQTINLKTETTKNQKEFIDRVNFSGGLAFFADSVKVVEDKIKNLQKEVKPE